MTALGLCQKYDTSNLTKYLKYVHSFCFIGGRKESLILKLFYALLLLAGTSFAQSNCGDVFAEIPTAIATYNDYEASETLSQKVRDNSKAYWGQVRGVSESAAWKKLPEILKTELIVPGDLHSGNFSVIGLRGRVPLYTFSDIKDLGYAPALFGMNQLVLNTIAVAAGKKNHKLEIDLTLDTQLWKAFAKGLGKDEYELHKTFEDEIPSAERLQKKRTKELEKRTDGDEILLRSENLKPLEEVFNSQDIKRLQRDVAENLELLLGRGKLLDLVVRQTDRGGSKDRIQLLAFYRTQRGDEFLKEFKEFSPPATSYYKTQPSFNLVVRRASDFLGYGVMRYFPLVTVVGRSYFVRDKKIEFISVPYKQKYDYQFEELMEMATAHAQWLGTFYRRQLTETNEHNKFLGALKEHQAEIIKLMRKLNKEELEKYRGML